MNIKHRQKQVARISISELSLCPNFVNAIAICIFIDLKHLFGFSGFFFGVKIIGGALGFYWNASLRIAVYTPDE